MHVHCYLALNRQGARERLEERRRVPGRDLKRGGGCQGEIEA